MPVLLDTFRFILYTNKSSDWRFHHQAQGKGEHKQEQAKNAKEPYPPVLFCEFPVRERPKPCDSGILQFHVTFDCLFFRQAVHWRICDSKRFLHCVYCVVCRLCFPRQRAADCACRKLAHIGKLLYRKPLIVPFCIYPRYSSFNIHDKHPIFHGYCTRAIRCNARLHG